MTWVKINAGFYWLEGTRYATASEYVNLEDGEFAASAKEWAVIKLRTAEKPGGNDGDNLDWVPTMREARAACERLAAKDA